LKKLTEKQTLQWTPDVETASQTLKEAFSTALLAHPESRESFVFDTDASTVSIGGVITSKVWD
jgi:hypothetical protein